MGRLSQSLNIFNGCQREVLIPQIKLFCSLPVPALQAAFTNGTHPLTGCNRKAISRTAARKQHFRENKTCDFYKELLNQMIVENPARHSDCQHTQK